MLARRMPFSAAAQQVGESGHVFNAVGQRYLELAPNKYTVPGARRSRLRAI